jgi:hypothetical protein
MSSKDSFKVSYIPVRVRVNSCCRGMALTIAIALRVTTDLDVRLSHMTTEV